MYNSTRVWPQSTTSIKIHQKFKINQLSSTSPANVFRTLYKHLRPKIFATHYSRASEGVSGGSGGVPLGGRGVESSSKSPTFYLNGPQNGSRSVNDAEEIRKTIVTLTYTRPNVPLLFKRINGMETCLIGIRY